MLQKSVLVEFPLAAAEPGAALRPATAGSLTEIAQARLAATSYQSLRALTCSSQTGVVAVRGEVSSYYLKQLAQTILRDIPGVREVQNHVQVVEIAPHAPRLPRGRNHRANP